MKQFLQSKSREKVVPFAIRNASFFAVRNEDADFSFRQMLSCLRMQCLQIMTGADGSCVNS